MVAVHEDCCLAIMSKQGRGAGPGDTRPALRRDTEGWRPSSCLTGCRPHQRLWVGIPHFAGTAAAILRRRSWT